MLLRWLDVQGGRGSRAVRTGGSGVLRGVRVINLQHDALFWFQVDSARPATDMAPLGPTVPATPCAKRERAELDRPVPAPSLPSWVVSAVKQEAPGDQDIGAGADAVRRHAAVMDAALARAKEWYAQRHAAWAGVRPGEAHLASATLDASDGCVEPVSKRRRL